VTRQGKKGNFPIGRRYLLLNMESWKAIYKGSWFTFDVGPALDIGKMWDAVSGPATDRFWIDAGAQVRFSILGNVTVAVSYGRPLRGGKGVLYGYPVHGIN